MLTTPKQIRRSSTSFGAEVFTFLSHEIESNWHLIEPFLRLVENPDWTIDEVKAELVQAKAQCWGMHDGIRISGVWITKLEEPARGRRGLLWIAAGEPLEEGLRLFNEHTLPWFKSMGCKSIRVIGRKGWERVLPDFENTGTVLDKELL